MPLPLIAAGVGAAGSILGGLLASRAGQQEVPRELSAQIANLQDRQFFLPFIQRAFGPEEETPFNINAQLAARGIDSPHVAEEQRQAAAARRGERITQAVQRLEGMRLNLLQRALGQRAQIESQNAQTRASAINAAIQGGVGSIVQGIGALGAQQQLGSVGQNIGRRFSPVGLSANNPTGTGSVGLSGANASSFLSNLTISGGNFGMNFGNNLTVPTPQFTTGPRSFLSNFGL